MALRRCAALLERLDDPRLTPDDDRDIRRALREEITLLWRTSELRSISPMPLDEVRAGLVFFDETLFTVVPRLYRALDAALDRVAIAEARRGRRPAERLAADDPDASDAGRTGTRPPMTRAFLHLGSWIGGDRDGNPSVTASVTAMTLRIAADHVLHGYEAVATRLMQTISTDVTSERLVSLSPALAAALAADAADFPELVRTLRRRFPTEPYRQRLGAIAERLRRTRSRLTDDGGPIAGGYDDPPALARELAELSDALEADGLERVAFGELADLRWQLDTFGFHLAELEIRQHAAVHAAALAVLRGRGRAAGRLPLDAELPGAPGVTAAEVLATFRAIAAIQATYGEIACRRYVISFTHGPEAVLAVLELASIAGEASPAATVTGGFAPAGPVLDVVPLFESADALATAARSSSRCWPTRPIESTSARAAIARRSCSATRTRTRSRASLAAAGCCTARSSARCDRRRDGIDADAVPRPWRCDRAWRRADDSRDPRPGGRLGRRRLKLTEQGEVIADRYANPAIALRHLEQLDARHAARALTDRTRPRLTMAAAHGTPLMDELADVARVAYRSLVWSDETFAGILPGCDADRGARRYAHRLTPGRPPRRVRRSR